MSCCNNNENFTWLSLLSKDALKAEYSNSKTQCCWSCLKKLNLVPICVGLLLKALKESWQGGFEWLSIDFCQNFYFFIQNNTNRSKEIRRPPIHFLPVPTQLQNQSRSRFAQNEAWMQFSKGKGSLRWLSLPPISFPLGIGFKVLQQMLWKTFLSALARCTAMFPVMFICKWLALYLKATEISQILHQSVVQLAEINCSRFNQVYLSVYTV